jgi:hypothetical protein
MSYFIIIATYLICTVTSGYVIRIVLNATTHKSLEAVVEEDIKETKEQQKRTIEIGAVIGKCENIIILTFVLLDAFTALALVVTAKTIVRKEDIEKNSMYFLAGTLINVAYSVLVGFALKLFLIKTAFKFSI